MLLHEDTFDLYIEDDSREVTCRLCEKDCPLAYMADGLCPGCFSLCASAPAPRPAVDAFTRRAHLVTLTRRAFVAYGEATALYNARVCALRPSASCIEEAHLLAQHRLRRFSLLESRLAKETGLPTYAVYNQIASFPACSRLLTAGL